MNEPEREASVIQVRVGAAHEGIAELVVTLCHDNGGTSEIALDHIATDALMRACDADNADDLIGTPWSKVRDALAASWNRFNPEQQTATS